MVSSILFVLLSILVSAYVVLPIFKGRSNSISQTGVGGNGRIKDLEERKHTIYSSIKDIDFDYQMGKLSQEDYETLRATYKQDAVSVLKEIEQASTPARDGAAPKKRSGSAALKFCWQCGNSLTTSDLFCANCGNQIR